MDTLVYIALVSGDSEGGYRARIPDLQDCRAEASSLAELLVNARKALSDSLCQLAETGESWPAAKPLEAFEPEPGIMPILVDVAVDDRPVRVNISLGERLLQRLDAAAEMRGMTRSGLIAQAVRINLGEQSRSDSGFEAANRVLQDELSAIGRGINEAIGPESAFGRRMADLDDKLFEGVRKAADGVSSAMARRQAAGRTARQAGSEPRPEAT